MSLSHDDPPSEIDLDYVWMLLPPLPVVLVHTALEIVLLHSNPFLRLGCRSRISLYFSATIADAHCFPVGEREGGKVQ